jgi:hypothetical protein
MRHIAFAAAFIATLALAGDDQVTSLSYTATQSCTAILRPKTNYAVQCTTDCYVRVQVDQAADAGTSVNTSSVLLSAGKLYDTPTTSGQLYICVVRSSASGTANIFIHREARE